MWSQVRFSWLKRGFSDRKLAPLPQKRPEMAEKYPKPHKKTGGLAGGGGCVWWLVAGVWWLVAGGWWLVAGGWWLVAGGCWLVDHCMLLVVFWLSAAFHRLPECRPLGVGCWLLGNTCWVMPSVWLLSAVCWLLAAGCWCVGTNY